MGNRITHRILDLFCCEGGAGVGYSHASFEVYGVDLDHKFKKRYPFGFHCGDALDVLRRLINGEKIEFICKDGSSKWFGLDDFDAVHASPPCQAYSITKNGHNKTYPKLIKPLRLLLIETGLPYVIENVVGAPLFQPITLCWSMFNEAGSVLDDDGTPLRMERHRIFESNLDLTTPRGDVHDKSVQVAGSYGGARRNKEEARNIRHGGYVPSADVQKRLLGIDWMTQHGMHQSLPPVYTEWIGNELLYQLEGAASV